MKIDLYNYVLKSLSGGAIMLLYDKLMENGSWNKSLYDSGVFAGSILSVNVIKDAFLG